MSIIEQLIQELNAENVMYTGVDAGNKSTKVSVLNKEGDIENFQFPTVMAQTTKEFDALADQQTEVTDPLERIHVKITSPAIAKHPQIYYVGEYAKDKENKDEPKADDARKSDKKLHIVASLTGLALAAWLTEREGEINAPFSGGLPIKEIEDESAEQYLNKFYGKHEVVALDGPFKGKKVIINIQEGIINVEGVTSELGISYMIEKGDVNSLPLSKKVSDTFAVVDAGAGTLDIGFYSSANGFEAASSRAYEIGTNPHIDKLMDRVLKELFADLYQRTQERGLNQKPYKTREQFMKRVIFPGVKTMIDNKGNKDFQPVFHANWGSTKADSEKLTAMVLETMTNYANQVLDAVLDYELETSVESLIFLGGGLLFGYHEIRKIDNEAYIYPDDLEKSASLTSNAYLIRSYGKKYKEVLKKEQTVEA